jgi:dTDP-glucose pyrophosphorylase
MKTMNNYIVPQHLSIKESLKGLDKGGIGFLAVVDNENNVIGVITDGDFRRAVLNGINLNDNVMSISNTNFKHLKFGYTQKEVQLIFNNTTVRHIPVLKDGQLHEIIQKESYETKDYKNFSEKLNTPVVVMAGGRGTRLEPFTKILPKPLIPIGDKTIIEIIIDEYKKYGITDFYISVNYKANMIKAYFEDNSEDIAIHYIEEEKPLGTAGSLRLIKDVIQNTFFVSNCDIIIKTNYSDIFEFHKNGNYDLTLIASMQHYEIPYGICEIENGGNLIKITEKPEYDFLVNTGMYILEPNVLEFIPENDLFHITHLIERLKSMNKKIGVYPVSKNSWIDVGQWDEYKRFMKLINDF